MYVLKLILALVLAYLIGNFQSGIIVSRGFGVKDIRKMGSGGTGTTNVLRNLGLYPSILVFLCDVIKGAVGVWIGRLFCGQIGAVFGGIAAIIGHNWPVLFAFRGGKGVATTLGALFMLEPILALIGFICAVSLIVIVRIVSIVSILGTFISAIVLCVMNPGNWLYIVFSIIAFLLVLYSHRENITRLLNGTERKLDFSAIRNLRR